MQSAWNLTQPEHIANLQQPVQMVLGLVAGLIVLGIAHVFFRILDFLRQRGLALWDKDHPEAQAIRKLAYAENRSYRTYKTYVEESSPEVAANALVCLIHQANYLFDQQLRQLEKAFLHEGGFTERLYRVRSQARRERQP